MTRPWGPIVALPCACVMLVALVVTLRNEVVLAAHVGVDEIYAAVTAYLLLGLGWATAYACLDWLDLDPPAFSRDLVACDIPRGIAGDFGDALYYSYVTLATVGYGDITPVNPVTRNLSTLEALTGQLYIALVLARLIPLYGAPRWGANDR